MKTAKHLTEYVISLEEKGEYCFTTNQALKALGVSKKAFQMSLGRLRKKKQLVTLSKKFHLIISPEYRSIGCLPPDHFISAYMQFLNLPYYVCLLSAAVYYGAAHQKPQVFQVMTNRQINSVICGKVTINFNFKKNISAMPIETFAVPTGYVKIATPEVTAMDLLKYNKSSGGINHVATVLTELIEKIDPEKMLQLAIDSGEVTWVQKLGYILESLELDANDKDKLLEQLKKFINECKPRYALLVNNGIDGMAIKNKTWRIIANHKIESDL